MRNQWSNIALSLPVIFTSGHWPSILVNEWPYFQPGHELSDLVSQRDLKSQNYPAGCLSVQDRHYYTVKSIQSRILRDSFDGSL